LAAALACRPSLLLMVISRSVMPVLVSSFAIRERAPERDDPPAA
jgi:hypothetical protein